jgi:hypothetical protein
VTSDLSGEVDARPVTFALFGNAYEIDLTEIEAKDLEKLFLPYVKRARVIGSKTAKAGSRTELAPDPKAVRAWAAAHGIECSRQGKIPGRVIDAYRAGH